jgi:glycerol-3-phosphate acyltransferase PlsY
MLSGYISLGSIIAAIAIPLTLFIRYNVFNVDIPGYHTIVYFMIAVSIIVLLAHKTNIYRILHGTESKFTKFQILKFGNKK